MNERKLLEHLKSQINFYMACEDSCELCKVRIDLLKELMKRIINKEFEKVTK